ncbi:hypothetical protein AADZ91_05210 [Colwelliaceae bacterium 6441]
MLKVNKKLWSFNIGSLIAFSFVWLVAFGNTVPVPEFLHPHPFFILDYYSGLVTAISAVMLTLLAVIIMGKGLNLCTSEHPFWLILPTLCTLVLTSVSAFEMVSHMLYAALPALFVMLIAIVTCRLARLRKEKVDEIV